MNTSGTLLLQRLHEQSDAQNLERARAQFSGTDEEFLSVAKQYYALTPKLRGQFIKQHGLSSEDSDTSQGTSLSLAVSAEMGSFLRHMVLSHRPTRILELGSSYGVSTLYFAEALRTLGGGTVVATELDAAKCAQIRTNIQTAEVESYVDLREGDVFQTVSTLEGSYDMVFIDVWANLYLDLFKQIEHLLRPGSIILADNMYTAEDEVRAYKEYIDQHPRFSSMTMNFESGAEFTVAL